MINYLNLKVKHNGLSMKISEIIAPCMKEELGKEFENNKCNLK